MLYTIVSGHLYAEISSWLTSSLPDDIKEYWKKIELRALVVLSLSMHLILNLMGYVKRKKEKAWLERFSWIPYHVGDWVSTVSLTTLLKRQTKEINSLEVFWAPFLLVHLGSAETMTARFIEQSKLWRNYAVGLLIQSNKAFYIFGVLRKGTAAFKSIANMIFMAGIIKCVDRILTLRSSSFSQLQKSVLSASAPKSFASVIIDDDKRYCNNVPKPKKLDEYLIDKNIIPEGRYLHGAYLSSKMFLPLFWDLKLGVYKSLDYLFNLESMSGKEAFKRVGTELGFLYDIFYSKTTLQSSVFSFILRSIFLLTSTLACIAFSVIISKHHYSYIDISITYFLLLGAILADMSAVRTHRFSKWTLSQLTSYSNAKLPKYFDKAVASWLKHSTESKGIKIKYMAQHSLLEQCLMTKVNKFTAVGKIIGMANVLEKFQYEGKRVKVDLELKDFIFSHLQKKREKYRQQKFESSFRSYLLKNGPDDLLKSKNLVAELGWSISKEQELTYTLLLWHIATDILYYNYRQRYPSGQPDPHCRISKVLSDYMIYLLVKRPFMLRIGFGELRYQDTFSEAKKFLQQEMRVQSTQSAAVALLGLDIECREFLQKVKGERKSVFFGGCRLARELQSVALDDRWDYEDIWELIKLVWAEMLVSAAYHSNWKEHAKQLGHGGELLTVVALLMAHLGLSKHIQMAELPQELLQLGGFNPSWDWENPNHLAYYLV